MVINKLQILCKKTKQNKTNNRYKEMQKEEGIRSDFGGCILEVTKQKRERENIEGGEKSRIKLYQYVYEI